MYFRFWILSSEIIGDLNETVKNESWSSRLFKIIVNIRYKNYEKKIALEYDHVVNASITLNSGLW